MISFKFTQTDSITFNKRGRRGGGGEGVNEFNKLEPLDV